MDRDPRARDWELRRGNCLIKEAGGTLLGYKERVVTKCRSFGCLVQQTSEHLLHSATPSRNIYVPRIFQNIFHELAIWSLQKHHISSLFIHDLCFPLPRLRYSNLQSCWKRTRTSFSRYISTNGTGQYDSGILHLNRCMFVEVSKTALND